MEAAGIVSELIDEERALCADLEATLHAERDALTSFSSSALSQCVEHKGELQRELTRLVERRRNAVRSLARDLGREAQDGRLVPLLPHLPPPEAARIRAGIGALRETLIRARRLQRTNGAMIDASLRLVGELVQTYRRFLPGARYDGRATLQPGPTPDAVDQRA